MCGPPCTNCKDHVYCHGPREYHGMCYGCYAIVQNIPKEELQKVNGKVYRAGDKIEVLDLDKFNF